MSTDIRADDNLGKPVRVRWTDSGMHIENGWTTAEDLMLAPNASAPGVLNVETVGLWMGETDEVVAIAQSRSVTNDHWMASQVIWKPSITAIEWL